MENKNRKQLFFYSIATKFLLHHEETIATSRGNKYHDLRQDSHIYILLPFSESDLTFFYYLCTALMRIYTLFHGRVPEKRLFRESA